MSSEKEGIPIQFIEFHPKKGFVITKEAIDYLSELENDSLGIIAIAGKYRTGKSFFVNRILLDKKDGGFGVGSTIKACTKGLWMWRKTIPSENPDNPGTKLLIIDTEGFGGIEENQNHDSKIFLLAILLSSYFIYNSMGTIDEIALQSLNLVINMAKEIKLSEDGGELSEEDIAMNFPSFMWVVRDFSLKLANNEGKKLTSAEYLESCLQPLKGVSENVENKNKIRRMLKFFFQDRDCVTVVRPAEGEEEIQNLNQADSSLFRKEFWDTMLKTRAKILRKVKPKRFNGNVLNGPMFLELAKGYVEVLNSGKTPNIQGAWNYLMESENQRATENVVRDVEKHLLDIKDESFFKDKHWKDKILAKARKEFESKALGDPEERQRYVEAMEAELAKKLDQFYSKRVGQQKDNIKKWIFDKSAGLMGKIKENKITNFQECESELEAIEKEFRKEYEHLPKELLDTIITEFRAEKQKELFAWLQMEASNREKREKQAMEMRIKQAQEDKERQAKLSEAKVADLKEKMSTFEKEGIEAQAKLESYAAKNSEINDKLAKAEKTLAQVKKDFKDRESQLKTEHTKLEEKHAHETEAMKHSFFLDKAALEKRISLLEQELLFRNKEIKDLQSQLEYEKHDKKRVQDEAFALKQKLDKKKEISPDEMIIKQEDYASMEKTIQSQFESIKQLEAKNSEERLNRQLAESKNSMLEEKLNENKNMSEVLIESLKVQLRNEDLSRSEISHLKRVNENEEQSKIKKLEGQLEKLKMYKFIFKYAQTIQCAICSRFFSSAMFLDHVLSELPPDQNPFKENDLSILRGLEEKEENQRLNTITVSIAQTMVREEPNKPGTSYTEYVIQVRTDSCHWNVSRRYRQFCELHNNLKAQFPYVAFPAVANEIFGTKDNLTKMLNSKKPTVIEDRRLNLQTYLRELLKMEVVCASAILRHFLEIEKYYDENNMLIIGRMKPGKSANASQRDIIHRGAPQFFRGSSHSELQYDDNMTPEEKQRYFLRKLNKEMSRK